MSETKQNQDTDQGLGQSGGLSKEHSSDQSVNLDLDDVSQALQSDAKASTEEAGNEAFAVKPKSDDFDSAKPRVDIQTEQETEAELEVPPTSERRPRVKGRKRRHLWRMCLHCLSTFLLFTLLAGLAIVLFTDQDIVLPDGLTNKIESRLNRDMGDVRISVGQLVVTVDDGFTPRIRARNVAIVDISGSEVMRVNSLQAALSLSNLRQKQYMPDTLNVSGAQIVVRRRADGTFALEFGGNAQTATKASDVPKLISAAFSEGIFAQVNTVAARDVTIALEDARSGRVWQATDVAILLQNATSDVEVSFDFDLFNGTEDLAKIQAGVSIDKASYLTGVALNVKNAPALDMAQQGPALAFLSMLDAPISAAMRAEIDGDARLVSYSGTLEVGAGTLAPKDGGLPLAFSGAKGYFDYDPTLERLTFPELTLMTDILEVKGNGHVLLSKFDGEWPTQFTGQFGLDHLSIDAGGVFDAPLVFDAGSVDLKLDLEPFAVHVGQLSLHQGDLWLRSSGRAAVSAEGWTAALDSKIDALSAEELMALWPEQALVNTRRWLAQNITAGQYRDIGLSVRMSPQMSAPQMHLDWTFDDATLRYIKNLPPAQEAAGYGSIHKNELLVVVQEGYIEAPAGGQINAANTLVRIPDLSQRPATLALDLQTQSSVEAALSLMSQPPFNILKSANFGPDVAQGTASLQGALSFELKQKVTLPDVSFDFKGVLRNVSSSQLLDGKTLRASEMALLVDERGLSIEGPVSIEGARAQARWSKLFGPEHAGRSDISGRVTLNQTLLDAFDIALPRDMISGSAQGALSVALRRGQDPAFTITSRLEGLGLSVPAIGFSKRQSSRGAFSIAGRAGDVPVVSNLSIEAQGLTASGGRVSLARNGSLERLSFDTFKVGNWLDSSVSLIGQGRNAPVKIRLAGGRLDLGNSPFGGGGSGSSSSGSPIDLTLDRLRVTDTLALHNASASLSQRSGQGLSGTFKGRLNGSADVTGTVSPGQFGPTIKVASRNAGRVIMAAELLEGASGGDFALTLVARNAPRSYDGTAEITNIKILSAPELAELLALVSVVGLLEQLSGPGIFFASIESRFTIHPDRIDIGPSTAEGPSLGISAEGRYTMGNKAIDIQGVISPIYFLNAIGQVVSRKGEGLFGFNFGLSGSVSNPKVSVNPLSILTPGALRGIFRKRDTQAQ